jgi:hypothetical protein
MRCGAWLPALEKRAKATSYRSAPREPVFRKHIFLVPRYSGAWPQQNLITGLLAVLREHLNVERRKTSRETQRSRLSSSRSVVVKPSLGQLQNFGA